MLGPPTHRGALDLVLSKACLPGSNCRIAGLSILPCSQRRSCRLEFDRRHSQTRVWCSFSRRARPNAECARAKTRRYSQN